MPPLWDDDDDELIGPTSWAVAGCAITTKTAAAASAALINLEIIIGDPSPEKSGSKLLKQGDSDSVKRQHAFQK